MSQPTDTDIGRLPTLARLCVRARFAVWLVVITGAGLLWAASRPVAFDHSIEGFFPEDHPALADYRRARQAFGGDQFLIVAYDDVRLWSVEGMRRIGELRQAIKESASGIGRIVAIDTQRLPWEFDRAVASASGPIEVGLRVMALKTVAASTAIVADLPEDLDALRRRICAHSLFRGSFVDAAGRTTALLVSLAAGTEEEAKRAVESVRRAADAFSGKHGLGPVAVAGAPVLIADGFSNLDQDNRTLGVVAMALMAAAMLIGVRSPWWAILPLLSGWTTWLVAETVMNLLRLRLTLSAGPVIAQSVVLCMPAACHMAMHFRAARRAGQDEETAARRTLVASAPPVLWCSLTAAAGYLALLSSPVRPVVHFGITMAACNLLAGALVYVLAAGAMRPPPWPRLLRGAGGPGTDTARIGTLTARVIRHPVRSLVLFVLPALVVATGVGALGFESDFIKAFRDRSRVSRDYRFVEERMGGIGLVEVVFPTPGTPAPEWAATLLDLGSRIQAVDRGLITQVLSFGDILAVDSGQGPRERIIEKKWRALDLPIFDDVVGDFRSRPVNTGGAGRPMRMLVRIREGESAERKERAFTAIRDLARRHLGEEAFLTGPSFLMTQVAGAVIATQFESTAWAVGLILAMLLLALRNLRWSFLALLPTTLAVAFVLGAMGWLGIRIDLSTALVASVAMGLSVDDTFHCLLRYRKEIRGGLPPSDALRASFAVAGPGVVLSSAAVSLGFLALVFSEFVPMANFGWLVAVATLGGSLGNLVLLPACLSLTSRHAGRR